MKTFEIGFEATCLVIFGCGLLAILGLIALILAPVIYEWRRRR